MATRFCNNEARIFNQLLDGVSFEAILENEKKRMSDINFSCSTEEAQKYIDEHIQKVIDVKKFFDRIKFLEESELYKVDPWGYGQTNYENLKVIGQMGGSMVCIIDNGHSDIYTIQKKKYTDKSEYTYLSSDRVRSTSWEEPYTKEELIRQSHYNAYYGH